MQSFVEEDYVIANIIPSEQFYNNGRNWTNYILSFTATFHQPFDFSGGRDDHGFTRSLDAYAISSKMVQQQIAFTTQTFQDQYQAQLHPMQKTCCIISRKSLHCQCIAYSVAPESRQKGGNDLIILLCSISL